jgi:hypothetical protein
LKSCPRQASGSLRRGGGGLCEELEEELGELEEEEEELGPALQKIEEIEISAEQKTFLTDLMKDNALMQVEIKSAIDSSAISIMEQEALLGQETLLLTQEKANQAIASANQLALAASQ